MPITVFKHSHKLGLSHSQIFDLGVKVRPIVARHCSIEGVLLTEDDIDWEPVERHPSSIAQGFAIEIETIDFPLRLEKLTQEATLALKAELAGALGEYLDVPDEPWLWVKYVSHSGFHV